MNQLSLLWDWWTNSPHNDESNLLIMMDQFSPRLWIHSSHNEESILLAMMNPFSPTMLNPFSSRWWIHSPRNDEYILLTMMNPFSSQWWIHSTHKMNPFSSQWWIHSLRNDHDGEYILAILILFFFKLNYPFYSILFYPHSEEYAVCTYVLHKFLPQHWSIHFIPLLIALSSQGETT